MDRRRFLHSCAAGAAWLAGGRALAQGAANRGLNVLWLGVDDLRCNLGCYGDPVAVTPNIDRLASRGTLFTRAYVQQAVCAASRGSFLTGCRPDTTTVDYPYNRYFMDQFLPAHPSLPAYAARHGFAVRTGGKIHHEGRELAPYQFARPAPKPATWRDYAAPESTAIDQAGGKPPAFECLEVPDEVYRDGHLAATVVEAIRDSAGEGKPFFYAAGFVKPHLPFNAPKKYWDLYDPARFTLPAHRELAANVTPLARASGEMPSYEGGQVDFGDEARLRRLTHGYYACTSYTDANLGKILDELDRQKLTERTIIMLWSDHGFHLGENQSFGKHTCFEMATHSPLIVAAPGLTPGQRCGALTEYVDLFPTICELAGLPKPDYLEGDSLVPLLQDPGRAGKRAAFSQYPRGNGREGFSIRTDRWRYTEWRQGQPGAAREGKVIGRELYDHQNDPAESHNLADEQPERVAELEAQLNAGWRAARA
ncbi:MAG: sulfatase, partial [Armatimonadetes bacterium]|nr:sulfatase [Armatimonadota bacterium]